MTDLFFDDLEKRRAEVERHQENSGRMAEAFGRFKSTGQGSIEFDERVDFGLTFIERPSMGYGCEIDLDEYDNMLGKEATVGMETPPMPICTGYVTDWDTDDRGFYVGAFVGVRVWIPYEGNVPVDFNVEVFHHYTFKAVAMKDVPIDLRD